VKHHEVLVNAVRELRPSVNQLVTIVGQELQVGKRLGPRRSHPDQKPIIALVHELNIIDKHRTIHLMRQQTNAFSWRVLRDIQPISLAVIPAMEDGAEWGEWTPTVIDDQPDIEFNIAFELAFAETTPTLNGKGVIEVCRALIQGVDRMVFFYLAGTLLPPPP
jgi:hypothetical protein